MAWRLWSLSRCFEHVFEVIAASLLVFLNLHKLHIDAEELGLWSSILVLCLKRCLRLMMMLIGRHLSGCHMEFICSGRPWWCHFWGDLSCGSLMVLVYEAVLRGLGVEVLHRLVEPRFYSLSFLNCSSRTVQLVCWRNVVIFKRWGLGRSCVDHDLPKQRLAWIWVS